MAARVASVCDGAVVGGVVVMARECCEGIATSLDDAVLDVLDKDEALYKALPFESCLAQDVAGTMASNVMADQ